LQKVELGYSASITRRTRSLASRGKRAATALLSNHPVEPAGTEVLDEVSATVVLVRRMRRENGQIQCSCPRPAAQGKSKIVTARSCPNPGTGHRDTHCNARHAERTMQLLGQHPVRSFVATGRGAPVGDKCHGFWRFPWHMRLCRAVWHASGMVHITTHHRTISHVILLSLRGLPLGTYLRTQVYS
jgi:hypothetical protein